MSSLEDLEARVSALEGQMRHVREDAAAARVLAGGADRDVSVLASRVDAQTRLLEALRETQVEHGQRIDNLESEMRRGFSTLAQGQAALERRQATLEQGQAGLVRGQATLEQGQAGLVRGQATLQRGQEMILDLLRRRNSEEPPTSAE